MTSKDLEFLTHLDAVAQAELVANGELSATELLEAYATRAERCEPLIHAIVAVDWESVPTQ